MNYHEIHNRRLHRLRAAPPPGLVPLRQPDSGSKGFPILGGQSQPSRACPYYHRPVTGPSLVGVRLFRLGPVMPLRLRPPVRLPRTTHPPDCLLTRAKSLRVHRHPANQIHVVGLDRRQRLRLDELGDDSLEVLMAAVRCNLQIDGPEMNPALLARFRARVLASPETVNDIYPHQFEVPDTRSAIARRVAEIKARRHA